MKQKDERYEATAKLSRAARAKLEAKADKRK